MVYDEGLAERVRGELMANDDVDERKMFGGLAFMVNTHMACGIVGDDLMVRVGKVAHVGPARELTGSGVIHEAS